MYLLVNYDLRNPGRDYASLDKALKELPDWHHCLDSVWLVSYPGIANELAEHLKQFVDANDQVLIVEIARDWASVNIAEQCADWLRTRLATGVLSACR